LRAITGNIAIPGGEIRWSPSGSIILEDVTVFFLKDMISDDMRQKKLAANAGLLPVIFYSPPQIIVKAILEGDPYPIHAVYLMGGSLLHTYSNANETYKALKKLDFLAASDLFMTPTAALADIVLPGATYLELDGIFEPQPFYNTMPQIQRKVVQIGECRPDYQILLELAKRLGLELEQRNRPKSTRLPIQLPKELKEIFSSLAAPFFEILSYIDSLHHLHIAAPPFVAWRINHSSYNVNTPTKAVLMF